MYNREFKEKFISSKDNADTIPMSFLYKIPYSTKICIPHIMESGYV